MAHFSKLCSQFAKFCVSPLQMVRNVRHPAYQVNWEVLDYFRYENVRHCVSNVR